MKDKLAGTGLRAATWNEGTSPIHYLERGGTEPTLVCLHGLGDSSLTFPEFVSTPALRSHRVVAPDAPGFGKSPRHDPAAWSLRGIAQSVLDLLHALDTGGFVIIGHSLGGAVGVHLARLAPYRCAGIISIEGNITLPDCSFSIEATDAEEKGSYADWRKKLQPRLKKEGKAGEEGKTRYLESFPLSDPETFLDVSRALVQESTDSWLGGLYADMAVPRLYLHGENSSPEETRAFLRNHALREKMFPEAGHWVHWDAREDAAEACREFMAGL